MSTATATQPRATAWAVGVATVAGLVALAVSQPILGLAALAGVALGIAVRALGRSSWWTALATAALPLGAFGVVVTVALPGSLLGGGLALAAIVVGVSLVSLVAGRLDSRRVALVVASAATGTLALIPAAILTTEAWSAGGAEAAGRTLLWLPGDGVVGLATWVAIAGTVAAVALAAPSPALTANLRAQPVEFRSTSNPAPAVLGGTLVLVLALLATVLIPGADRVTEPVAASTPLRAALAGITVLAVLVACLAVLSRLVWDGSRETPLVALAVGATVGAVAVSALAAVVSATQEYALSTVFLPTIVGVVALALVTGWVTDEFEFGELLGGEGATAGYRRPGPGRNKSYGGSAAAFRDPSSPVLSLPVGRVLGAETLVPVGLVAAAVLLAVELEGALALEQVGVLVAIASALFVHAALVRGRSAARDVGVGNVSTLPQVVWLGWTATVALLGLAVAIAGILFAGRVAVVASLPAALGVVSALGALLAGVWLLLR